MPKKDYTGPTGNGPMTGRCRGRCILPLNTPDEELNYLRNRKKGLKEQLQEVETRLKELKKEVSGGEK
jgi:hypothetical protein